MAEIIKIGLVEHTFTPEQWAQAHAMRETFMSVAGRNGWNTRWVPSMATRCVAFGLETMDRFPVISLTMFNHNTNMIDNNSRIVFRAMEEAVVEFSKPAEKDESYRWPEALWEKFWPMTEALKAAAATVPQKQHANAMAIKAVQVGLEDLGRWSRVNESFFRTVMGIKSPALHELARAALSAQNMSFRNAS